MRASRYGQQQKSKKSPSHLHTHPILTLPDEAITRPPIGQKHSLRLESDRDTLMPMRCDQWRMGRHLVATTRHFIAAVRRSADDSTVIRRPGRDVGSDSDDGGDSSSPTPLTRRRVYLQAEEAAYLVPEIASDRKRKWSTIT